MDHALTVVPLLEVVTSVLLMGRVNSGKVLHHGEELCLLETLVHQQVVFLMHSSVASLARSAEDFETSAQRGGVEGVPGDVVGPVSVSVVETHRVDLLFVTLNSMRGAD